MIHAKNTALNGYLLGLLGGIAFGHLPHCQALDGATIAFGLAVAVIVPIGEPMPIRA